MEKSVSSPKIFNIIVCILILIAFCILGAKVNVHASDASTYEEIVLPSVPER